MRRRISVFFLNLRLLHLEVLVYGLSGFQRLVVLENGDISLLGSSSDARRGAGVIGARSLTSGQGTVADSISRALGKLLLNPKIGR